MSLYFDTLRESRLRRTAPSRPWTSRSATIGDAAPGDVFGGRGLPGRLRPADRPVQAARPPAGARLQTLIIDEGFGSQDAKGREKLVDCLDAIKDDFERIIVITHIDELKDAFATRVEITKTPSGSRSPSWKAQRVEAALRWVLAAVAGVALTLLLNRIGVWWLGANDFASDSFYDGCAASPDPDAPRLPGGPRRRLRRPRTGAKRCRPCLCRLLRVRLRPPVLAHPAGSPSRPIPAACTTSYTAPLVALAFGSLGAWGASQFSTGKWTLTDPEPVSPQE